MVQARKFAISSKINKHKQSQPFQILHFSSKIFSAGAALNKLWWIGSISERRNLIKETLAIDNIIWILPEQTTNSIPNFASVNNFFKDKAAHLFRDVSKNTCY